MPSSPLQPPSAQMPRVLIFLLSWQWMGISRLPKALSQAGFEVVTLGPAGSFLSRTAYAQRHYSMPVGANVLDWLLKVVGSEQPQLVVPGCDSAVTVLHYFERVHGAAAAGDPAQLAALIRESLGNADHYGTTESKHALSAYAEKLGIPVPPQAPAESATDAQAFAQRHGYPAVLKAEASAAGLGVRICADAQEVERGLLSLAPYVEEQRKGGLVGSRIHVQRHVRGVEAMQSFVARCGQVLEQVTIVKEHCHPEGTGPSSVVRFVEQPEVDGHIKALVAGLGYSGFGSADFIIEETSGTPYLLELNPRPCPISPIGRLAGHDLCRALYCAMTGTAYERIRATDPVARVALFPQEWQRDPRSPLLSEAFHDVPWDDPELLRALVGTP